MNLSSLMWAGAAALGLAACTATDLNAPTRTVASASSASSATDDPWFAAGQETLAARKAVTHNNARAKNVILFVGDGMDPTTVTAARIYDGQTRGADGEENLLSFETFPHVAYSKIYTTNYQVPDSAGTMSAMVTGVKTKSGVLS
ncbi:MAG: alkaline phosphatase, partial [Hyphococcus sp.]